MKVRIQGNTMRFRLKQFEVEALAGKKCIIEELMFPGNGSGTLQFVLQPSIENECNVEYKNGKVIVSIPEIQIENWSLTAQVGIASDIPVKNRQSLQILIEKDFKCLNEQEDDSLGSYPNPMAAC